MMTISAEYRGFLAARAQLDGDSGFEPIWIPDFLFDFQKALVEWAIRKGRAAIFADCGLGKTPMQLVFAENVIRKENRPVLILTPLAVSAQTLREAEKFGIEAVRSRGATPSKATVVITNYERLHLFNPDDFTGVVADECFAAGTKIDTPAGTVAIEDVTPGMKILNAAGRDVVVATRKRKIDAAVKITIGSEQVICSDNHPWFTSEGWRRAIRVRQGTSVMATSEAMRMVRDDVHDQIRPDGQDAFLRTLLLSEMANVTTGASGEGSHTRDARENWEEGFGMVAQYAGGSGECASLCLYQADAARRDAGTRVSNSARDGSRAYGARRQRPRPDETTGYFRVSARRRMADGIRRFLGSCAKNWISDVLQGRYRRLASQDRDRGRWLQPQSARTAVTRPQERRDARFARVDRVEILESGHPELERFRDAGGSLYFYDIEAARHPSFSVGGILVHNSSILKNYDGTRKAQITEFMRTIPYRLTCTATAAPNDYIELGTTSEALGYLGYMDMLSKFFKNDQNSNHPNRLWAAGAKWRFRGHAERDFWRWVCSWGRALRKPSDMGFADGDFILPALHTREHVVAAATPREGMLFDTPAITLEEQREERRRTLRERCELAAELISARKDASVAWCHLNDEGDLLTRLIPEAVQVSGSDADEAKEEKFLAFASGEIRRIVTKDSIACYGLNWQHCSHMTTFASHSWERYYQAIHRFLRFGQQNEVTSDVIASTGEAGVVANLKRKSDAMDKMFARLVETMNDALAIQRTTQFKVTEALPSWLSSNRR